jgi:putative transposase
LRGFGSPSHGFFVRQSRIKVDPREEVSCYHCVTRTVNGEFLFDDSAREVLRRMIWRIADFCGVEILTYAVLSNHFHVLVRVPLKVSISDEELLRRYKVLYTEATPYQTAHLNVVRSRLAENDHWAEAWRSRQLALMGDVSQFMKLLKQRFSIWFNRRHGRFGTLWAERFRSVLLEGKQSVLETVAAYIDLNPVRAGLVADPLDYRFCGYAEAVAGSEAAQFGIQSIYGAAEWGRVHDRYRMRLFASGSVEREGMAGIRPLDFARVVAEKGKVPLATVMMCRIRYFTHGAVLGGRAFVQAHLEKSRLNSGSYRTRSVVSLPPITDWGDLVSMVAVRF